AAPAPTAPSARGSTTPARARATTAPTPLRCRPRSASATPGTTSARRWRRARNESRAALRLDRRRRAGALPVRIRTREGRRLLPDRGDLCRRLRDPQYRRLPGAAGLLALPRVLHLRLAEQ